MTDVKDYPPYLDYPKERKARRILRPGDKCPCCGQPISATDEQVLLCLTRIAELTPGYEWPEAARRSEVISCGNDAG